VATTGADRPFGPVVFETAIWLATGGSWHFVSLPPPDADDILEQVGAGGPGFGSVRVSVELGGSRWQTSIFPDSRRGTYVLPIKKAVRTAEQVGAGDVVTVTLTLL